MIRDTVRAFAEQEIVPVAREHDERAYFDRNIVAKMARLGLLGGPIPPRYGGSGLDYLSLALTCEELGRGELGISSIITVHVALNSLTLLQWGTEEQRQKYLVPQARGEKLACFGLTEPNTGTDAGNLETTARREGDHYILNGTKTWITLADVADHFLVFASLDRSLKHRAICAFILERSFPGLSTSSIHGKLGLRLSNSGEIHLQDCPVPKENLLGQEGEGFRIAMSALDGGRLCTAAGAVGLAQACLEASVAYANQRQAFGQPIGRFQLVQEMIAQMVAGVEAARLLLYRVAALRNQGRRATQEASLAKWFATDVAMKAATDAVQIHGSYGYSNAYPVERYFRNAKAAQIYEGTNQLHQLLQAEYALGYRQEVPLRCPPPLPYGREGMP